MRVERALLPFRFDIDMDAFGSGTSNPRKRTRDDDDVERDAARAEKRSRNDSLLAPSPFALLRRPSISRSRTSPFPFRFGSSPPLPPPDSPEENESASSTRSLSPASVRSLPNLPDPVPDIDMHDSLDAISIVGSNSPPSPFKDTPTFARPAKPAMLQPQSLLPSAQPANEQFAGGRVPTPIFPSFAASLNASPQSQQSLSAPASSQTAEDSFVKAPSYLMQRPKPVFESDYRIPSPIHEDAMEIADSQLSRLSFHSSTDEPPASNSNSGSSMDLGLDTSVGPSGYGSTSDPRVDSAIDPGSAVDKPPTPLARKGRARSGAISSSPGSPRGWHGLSGRRFFMGYRDDCEKCRMRIPGHFAHFLPG